MSSGGIPVSPVGGPVGRGPLVAAGVLGVLLLVAIVKPWAGGPDTGRPSRERPSPSAEATPAPSPSTTPRLAEIDRACLNENGWRVFTVGTNAGIAVNTWYSIDPVRASGPTDPSIATLRVYDETLTRLGYCTAVSGTVRRQVRTTEGWRVSPSGVAVPIWLLAAPDSGLHDRDVGALFAPLSARNGAPRPAWDPARYVFAVRFDAEPADAVWFAVQVIRVTRVPAPEETHAPTAAPPRD